MVALATLPLLSVIIAGTIKGTAQNIRELRHQRTREERETAARLRRMQRAHARATHAEETDLAA